MATHRPLSAWIARVLPDRVTLGAVNDGDERADARHLEFFADGWLRRALPWDGRSILALSRAADGLTVVELDDYGIPIAASPAAVAVIERAEETWPYVNGEILALADEQLALRYWVLERLDEEGQPPDEVFAILPWDLLDRAIEAVGAALEPGGTPGELVEMRHWLTPAVRGLTGPLEQLDHGLRTGAPDIARRGTTTLLTNLRDLPLSRVPATSRRRLGTLVGLLGRSAAEHRELAGVVGRRLVDGASAVPDDLSSVWFALVVPARYLGPGDDVPAVDRAKLEFGGPAESVLGPDVRGRVTRSGTELTVTLTRFGSDLPRITVDTGEPDAVPVPLVEEGKVLRAKVPWSRQDLPQRLVFRVVAG